MLQLHDGDDILVVTTKGKMIRFHAADVSSQGRNTGACASSISRRTNRVGSVAPSTESAAPVDAA